MMRIVRVVRREYILIGEKMECEIGEEEGKGNPSPSHVGWLEVHGS